LIVNIDSEDLYIQKYVFVHHNIIYILKKQTQIQKSWDIL